MLIRSRSLRRFGLGHLVQSLFISMVVVGLLVGGVMSVVLSSSTEALPGDYTWQKLTGKDNVVGDSLGWTGVASSADGTKLAAMIGGYSNSSYIYTSVDSGATWIERASAGSRAWTAIASSDDGMKLVATATNGIASETGNVYTSDDGGVTWQEQTTPSSRLWQTVASSSDGSKLVAASSDGYIYTSIDSGVTWTQQIDSGSRNWRSVASSADGTKLVAVVSQSFFSTTGNVYTSDDGGESWVDQTTPNSVNWTRVASSADGSKLVAIETGNYYAGSNIGYLYESTDFGETWTANPNAGKRQWTGVSISADGNTIAGSQNTGLLYISTDGGDSWESLLPSGDSTLGTVISVAFSAGGSAAVMTINGGSLYTTVNSGQDWFKRTIRGSATWKSIAVSSDGTKVVAAKNGNNQSYIYTSVDSGSTWVEQTSSGFMNWSGVAITADGNTIIALPQRGATCDVVVELSTDGGASWDEKAIVPCEDTGSLPGSPNSIAVSPDGTKMVVGFVSGYIYTSSDSGDSWSEHQSVGTHPWYGVAISADGSRLAAVAVDGVLYTSSDHGTTWHDRTSQTGSHPWNNVVASSDGLRMIAIHSRDACEITMSRSSDGGDNWEQLEMFSCDESSAFSGSFNDIASSADGTKLAIVATGGFVHTSADSGTTWTTQLSSGSRDWAKVASSTDGTKLLFTVSTDSIYSATKELPSLEFTPQTGDSTSLPTNSTPTSPESIANVRPTFSGVSYPNATITITVHSDPIVCTTIADSEGNWSCTLPADIPSGTHTIMVVMTNPLTGEEHELGPYYVLVDGDETTITNNTPGIPNTGIFMPDGAGPFSINISQESNSSRENAVPAPLIISMAGGVAVALILAAVIRDMRLRLGRTP